MKIKNIIKDNRGFTLIELLAVITILSVVMSIGIYVSFDAIKEAREKSYKVTKANIENNASSYVKENFDKLTYVDVVADSAAEYQCVTVGDLVESGYLSQKVTDSKVSDDTKVSLDDYVYVERNKKSKTLTKSEYNGGAVGYCDISSAGDISFSVSPDNNKWSRSKTVTITYKVVNHTPGNTYNFTHTVINTETNSSSSGNNNTSPKTININKPSSITAKIFINGKSDTESTINISKIDTVGPTIEFDPSIKGNYNGSVKIPINIVDTQSGLNKTTVEKEDFVITIGGVAPKQYTLKELTNNSNYNYELEIIDDIHSGDVVITVEKGKILDNVENENNLKKLENKFTMNMGYTVKFNANGGNGIMSDQQFVKDEQKALTANSFTRTNYTFAGWNTKADGTGQSYSDKEVVKNLTSSSTITLYAQWQDSSCYCPNGTVQNNKSLGGKICVVDGIKITGSNPSGVISYVIGGLCISTVLGWHTEDNHCFADDHGCGTTTPGYDKAYIECVNAVNDCALAAGGPQVFSEIKQYCGEGKDFTQEVEMTTCPEGFTYDNSLGKCYKLCDGSNTSGYTVKFNANGGEGKMANQSFNKDEQKALTANSFTRTGYTFKGWNTKSDGTGTSYSDKQVVKNLTTTNGAVITMYAQWEKSTCNCPDGTVKNDASLGGDICVVNPTIVISSIPTIVVEEGCINKYVPGCFEGATDHDRCSSINIPELIASGIGCAGQAYACLESAGNAGGYNCLSDYRAEYDNNCPDGFTLNSSIVDGKTVLTCYKKCGEETSGSWSCDLGMPTYDENLGHICYIPLGMSFKGNKNGLGGWNAGCLTTNFGCNFSNNYNGFIPGGVSSEADSALADCAKIIGSSNISQANKLCADRIEFGESGSGQITSCGSFSGFIPYPYNDKACYKKATYTSK